MVRTLALTLEKKKTPSKTLTNTQARVRLRLCLRRWPTRYKRCRPKTFCETVGDVEALSLLKTMHYSLAEMKA